MPPPIRAHRGTRPRGRSIAAAVLVAAAAVLTPAGPAHAAPVSVTCTGSSALTYSPGMRFTPRNIDFTETNTYTGCISSDPAVTSGHASDAYTSEFSCLNPLITGTGETFIDWNNGQSSTFALTFTDTIAGAVETVTGTGTITSGQFTGATAVIVWIYTIPNALNCLTPTGVTSQSGTIAVTILGT